jgi:hypothetical protein
MLKSDRQNNTADLIYPVYDIYDLLRVYSSLFPPYFHFFSILKREEQKLTDDHVKLLCRISIATSEVNIIIVEG